MSPAELLFGRRLRSRLDLLKPDLYKRVEREQERQKEAHDRHSQDRSLLVGDAVYVRNFGRGPTWLAGQIIEQPGPRKYKIRLADDGIVWCRHKDHVRRRYVLSDSHCEPVPLPVTVPIPSVPNSDDSGSVPQVAEGTSPAEDQEPRPPIHPATPEAAATAATETTHSNVEPTRRYPQRIRKPPDRYSSD